MITEFITSPHSHEAAVTPILFKKQTPNPPHRMRTTKAPPSPAHLASINQLKADLLQELWEGPDDSPEADHLILELAKLLRVAR